MKPRLVFDGDCGFCRYTVRYAERVTGDAVEYRPYQEVAGEYPELSEADFAGSIQLFDDGARRQGAEAAFRTLALGGRGCWLRVYRLPGLAPVFEWLYALVARHRGLCHRVARLLFGADLGPRHHRAIADWVCRGIALCGAFAFASFFWQVDGLIGSGGVLPVTAFFTSLHDHYGARIYTMLPDLLWLNDSDAALASLCVAGLAATLIGICGRLRFITAVVAYVCYLSLFHAGQVFMGYQWDVLLVECFVLQLVLARAPTLGIWLARALLFRFMLLSGAVKVLSGDPTWADGSALAYHFHTQPLPTALAWYADKLPDAVLRFGVHATLFIELVLPFCIFLPRNPRLLAGAAFALLELLILLTGSYNFFNLLTLVLCLALLDDRDLGRLAKALRGIRPRRFGRGAVRALAVLILAQGLTLTWAGATGSEPPGMVRYAAPWLLANRYGVFAVMTTRRNELVVEGSPDGEQWRAYGFPFKPGPLAERPRLATPHQPRLDWQMWFAALGGPEQAPWIYDFVFALLEARPDVLALLDDPFDGERPRYVRILSYPYRFTTREERDATGNWWARGDPVVWLSPVALRKPRITHGPLTLDQ